MVKQQKKSKPSFDKRKIVQIASGDVDMPSDNPFWLAGRQRRTALYALTDDGALWMVEYDPYSRQTTLVELVYTYTKQRRLHDE